MYAHLRLITITFIDSLFSSLNRYIGNQWHDRQVKVIKWPLLSDINGIVAVLNRACCRSAGLPQKSLLYSHSLINSSHQNQLSQYFSQSIPGIGLVFCCRLSLGCWCFPLCRHVGNTWAFYRWQKTFYRLLYPDSTLCSHPCPGLSASLDVHRFNIEETHIGNINTCV